MRLLNRLRPTRPSPKTSFVLGLLLCLFTLSLTGCGRSNDTGQAQSSLPGKATAAASGSADFKVALVMSGPISDNGWNAGAYKALQEVKKQLNLGDDQVSFKENAKSDSDQNENLQYYASHQFNVVFGHGNEYEKPALRMASDFPKTLFVISSGSQVAPNVTPIVFKLEDGAYLLGMLAAGMSQSGKIGAVGAQQIPPVKSVFQAYASGAKAVRSDITVVPPVYTNDWDDVEKAKQATLPLISQGVDVIIQDLDAAAQGVFNAVQQSNRPDHPVYALGTNNDQNSAAPGVVLASAPIYLSPVFVKIAQQAKDGTFKPSASPYGMPEGVIGFVLNPQLESKIPAALKQKLDNTMQQIKSRSLNIPMAG